MSIWDDPEVVPSGTFVQFENEGDTVAGTITAIGKHTFPDGKVVPQLQITTDAGEDMTMSVGQVRLKALMSEQRPEVGDHITVAYVRKERRDGGKTMKHFTLAVKRGAPAEGTPPF